MHVFVSYFLSADCPRVRAWAAYAHPMHIIFFLHDLCTDSPRGSARADVATSAAQTALVLIYIYGPDEFILRTVINFDIQIKL
jgi:hypothetical protein